MLFVLALGSNSWQVPHTQLHLLREDLTLLVTWDLPRS